MTESLEQVLAAYDTWMERQPLAAKTRVAYRLQVHQYGAYLAQRSPTADDPLHTPFARDYAVRDYKLYLKTERQARPTSVNLALSAIDHFYQFLGHGRPHVQRENLPTQAPRALKLEEQKTFLCAVERTPSVRDKALAHLLFYTAVRLGDCATLNLDDVRISARKGIVVIRSGKGDTYREVPLLRHTCLTSLVRRGNNLVLVTEIAGHKRLETTRRYCLPSLEDRASAMEGLRVEY